MVLGRHSSTRGCSTAHIGTGRAGGAARNPPYSSMLAAPRAQLCRLRVTDGTAAAKHCIAVLLQRRRRGGERQEEREPHPAAFLP